MDTTVELNYLFGELRCVKKLRFFKNVLLAMLAN